MVNIAVFAAFHGVISVVLLSNPDFKRVFWTCRPHEGGKSGKKWQDRGKDVARNGKVGGKSGKSGNDLTPLPRNSLGEGAAGRTGSVLGRDMRLFRCFHMTDVVRTCVLVVSVP